MEIKFSLKIRANAEHAFGKVRKMRSLKSFFGAAILATLIIGTAGLPRADFEVQAASAKCTSVPAKLLLPDDTRGIRTKWRFRAGVDARGSFQPNLFGLSLEQWMQELEKSSVNLAELNLDPREKTAPADQVPSAQMETYIAAIDKPDAKLTNTEATARRQVEDEIVPNYRYTPEFRDRVLLRFLERLEKLRQEGKIKGSVKFILHQRQWFRPGNSPRAEALRERRVKDFTADMSNFINLARKNCVDHWIAGIRLGESYNRNVPQYLGVLLALADDINRATDGWLMKHLFVANGPGMGAQYRGFKNAFAPNGRYADFFARMSKRTGSFAFGYKWMQFEGNDERHIAKIMDNAQCKAGKDCDVKSEADWTFYLGQRLGFQELKQVINANHKAYPNHANVLFVGDSADAVVLMAAPAKNKLEPDPELEALYDLWPDAGTPGWSGRLFMNGFADAKTYPNHASESDQDFGAALMYVTKSGKVVPSPWSKKIWSSWPNPPS